MSYTNTMKGTFGKASLIGEVTDAIHNVIREARAKRKERKKTKDKLDIVFSFDDLSDNKKELLLLTIKRIKHMKEEDVLFFIDSINQCEQEKGKYKYESYDRN